MSELQPQVSITMTATRPRRPRWRGRSNTATTTTTAHMTYILALGWIINLQSEWCLGKLQLLTMPSITPCQILCMVYLTTCTWSRANVWFILSLFYAFHLLQSVNTVCSLEISLNCYILHIVIQSPQHNTSEQKWFYCLWYMHFSEGSTAWKFLKAS